MRFFKTSGGEHGPPHTAAHFSRRLFASVVVCGLALLVTSTARANSVELTFIGITANGSNFDYHYNATLTPNNYIQTNDTVTFFDFEGFVAGSFLGDPALGGPAYTLTSSDDSPIQPVLPGETPPAGDLSIGDILFTYSGVSPYLQGPGNSAPGDIFIGEFTLTSSYNTGAKDVVQSTDTSAGQDGKIGTADDSFNQVNRITTVARNGGFPTPSVPLPLPALAGSALFGMIGVARRKNAKAAA